MPLELKRALAKDKVAKSNFENFPASVKKMIYRWILRGKLEKTRSKRIEICVEKASANIRDVFGPQGKING